MVDEPVASGERVDAARVHPAGKIESVSWPRQATCRHRSSCYSEARYAHDAVARHRLEIVELDHVMKAGWMPGMG